MISQRLHKILLIESDPRYARFIRTLLDELSELGSEVNWIERLPHGMNRSTLQPFHLIIYSLSGGDDLELATLSRLRSLAETTPVVALSPVLDGQLSARLEAAGATTCAEKNSLDAKTLSAILETLLTTGRGQTAFGPFTSHSLIRMVETFRLGYWHLTATGRTLFINQAMRQLLGVIQEEQLEGRGLDTFLAKEGASRQARLRRRRAKGEPFSYIARFPSLGGWKREILVFEHPLRNRGGQLESVWITAMELSQFASLSRPLSGFPEGQATLAELSRLALAGADLNSILKRAVDLLVETDGLEACRIRQWQDGALRVRETRNWPLLRSESAAEGAETADTCEEITARHGVFSQSAIAIDSGMGLWGILEAGRSGATGIQPDEIRALQRVGELLSQAIESLRVRRQWQRLISRLQAETDAGSPASICLNEEGVVVNWNQAAFRLFGWNALQALGRPLPIIPESASRAWRQLCDRLLAEGGEATQRWTWQKSDGTRFEGQARLVALRDPGNRILGLLLQFPTPESVLPEGFPGPMVKEEAEKSPVPGEEKMRSLGRMAGGIAHELNNLFTIIRCYGDLLSRPLAQDEQLSAHLEAIFGALERGKVMTGRLHALEGQSELKPELCDLNKLILDNEARLRGLLGESIALSLQLDPGLAPVSVDREKMVELIHEMTVNSRSAMPRGGKLEIRTGNLDARDLPKSSIFADTSGSLSIIEFRDTGTGIDPDIIDQVFEPFFSTRPGSKGLGLTFGLAFVRQSGGDILLESRPGEGARFRICLPAISEKEGRVEPVISGESKAPPGPAAPEAPRTARTVLLVERNDPVRELVREILSDHGYQVLESTDVESIMRDAESQSLHADLLITEVEMPAMTGYELARRLSGFLPQMKTLYLADFPETEAGRSEVLGTDSPFLKKPFKAAELVEKVTRLLD